MKTVEDERDIGICNVADNAPGIAGIEHMRAPRQCFINKAEAALRRALTRFGKMVDDACPVARTARINIRATRLLIRAQIGHQVEFPFQPVERPGVQIFWHPFEIAEWLKHGTGQPEVRHHPPHFSRTR